MSVASFNIRAAVAGDAAACAATAYAAHARVSAVHNFPPELPTLEVATRFIRSKLENPRCRGYVAEKDGYVVGSVFVTAVDDCPAGAIGPLTVEPAHEGGVGAALMARGSHRSCAYEYRTASPDPIAHPLAFSGALHEGGVRFARALARRHQHCSHPRRR